MTLLKLKCLDNSIYFHDVGNSCKKQKKTIEIINLNLKNYFDKHYQKLRIHK